MQYLDLVDQILDAKRTNPEADISEIETKVEKMVTELYGISQTEEDKIENVNSC